MFPRRVWTWLAFLGGLSLVGCGSSSTSTPVQGGSATRAAVGRTAVLIGFTAAPGAAEAELIERQGGSIKYRYRLVRGFAATLPDAAIDGLRHNPKIASIDPDVTVQKTDAELDAAWGVKKIGSGTVHDGGNTGSGVKVAILDTGIDYSHPDLAANYQGGYDFVNNDADPRDDEGHGTHVAGTVAAADDGQGVVGVAPGAALYALKVLDSSGSGSFSSIIAALEWCVANGIQVTNNSYGSSQDPGPLVQQAFDAAQAAGIVNVASAGNSGNPSGKGDNVGYPARYASTIAVAATDASDARASFSSTGAAVELSAPGVGVSSCKLGGGYISYSGTSMASPHVAGAVALCLAAGQSDPRGLLATTAVDLGVSGRDAKFGYGRIDLVAALIGAPPPPPPPPPSGALAVSVATDKASYANRETVVITSTVTDGANPVAGATVTVRIAFPSGNTFTATATTNGAGVATVQYKVNAKRSGSGVASVASTASAAGYTGGSASTTFTIL